MKENKVLIIGGAGFLGQTIAKKLYPLLGRYLVLADILPKIDFPGNYFQLDILSKECFKRVPEDFNTVINCTGQITNPINQCFKLNTSGIKNILDFVKKCNARLIHISTISVYGSSSEYIEEDSPLNPESPYASFKAVAEFEIQSELEVEKFAILRLSNLYGDNQKKGVIAYLLRAIPRGEKLFFNHNGSLKRHYIHIDDAAKIICQAVSGLQYGIYNVCSRDFITIRELVNNIESITGKTIMVEYERTEPWENIEKVGDKKLRTTFNVQFNNTINKYLTNKLS